MPGSRGAIAGFALVSAGLALLDSGCSSAPPPRAEAPPWTHAPSVRTIEDGRILFVGSGEDRDAAQAAFKAEAMGYQDVANECSLVPRGALVVDRYATSVGIIHRAFARVAVEAGACESARAALDPARIRAVVDVALTGEVRRYQDLVDDPEPEESAALPASQTIPLTDSAESYFVVRQQLALAKQDVALAPADAAVSMTGIRPAAEFIARSAAAKPELALGAFSLGRPHWLDHQAAALRDSKAERARIKQEYTEPPVAHTSPKKEPERRGRRGRRMGVPAGSGQQPQNTDATAFPPGPGASPRPN